MNYLQIIKAADAQPLTIEIKEAPFLGPWEEGALYERQAKVLVNALWASLPRGMMHRVATMLMERVMGECTQTTKKQEKIIEQIRHISKDVIGNENLLKDLVETMKEKDLDSLLSKLQAVLPF